jgi:hypothetical protein
MPAFAAVFVVGAAYSGALRISVIRFHEYGISCRYPPSWKRRLFAWCRWLLRCACQKHIELLSPSFNARSCSCTHSKRQSNCNPPMLQMAIARTCCGTASDPGSNACLRRCGSWAQSIPTLSLWRSMLSRPCAAAATMREAFCKSWSLQSLPTLQCCALMKVHARSSLGRFFASLSPSRCASSVGFQIQSRLATSCNPSCDFHPAQASGSDVCPQARPWLSRPSLRWACTGPYSDWQRLGAGEGGHVAGSAAVPS